MIIGEVCLERADARLAHRCEVGAVALVPLGQRHMEGIVGRAGAVGAAVPFGEGIGHRHTAVGRGVVDDRRGAAARRGARARLEAVGCPIHTGPALHMGVPVDKTGEDPAIGGVLDDIAGGGLDPGGDLHDLIAVHGKVRTPQTLRRHQRTVLDDDHDCPFCV